MQKPSVGLAMVATLLSLGCGTQSNKSAVSSPKGGIAVVDLDRVASETGKGTEMSDALQLQRESLQQAFSAQQNRAKSLLEEKAKDLNIELSDLKHASPEAQQELKQANINLVSQLQSMQSKASRDLSNYQQALLAKFRAELKPILQEAASKRGLGVVIPKNDGLLLTVDPTVDITDDVIKAYNTKQPSLNAAQTAKQTPESKPAAAQSATKSGNKLEKTRTTREKKQEAREASKDGEEAQS